jgi:UDP-N-acetylmuramate--alanine ligase
MPASASSTPARTPRGGDFRSHTAMDARWALSTCPLLGAHNLLNAAAALAAACLMGIDPRPPAAPWPHFPDPPGASSSKERLRASRSIDDYGHHPTEVRATLAALRLLAPRRLVVLFQPHRYTRTQALLDEFATAFHDADAVRVLDIYAASERLCRASMPDSSPGA